MRELGLGAITCHIEHVNWWTLESGRDLLREAHILTHSTVLIEMEPYDPEEMETGDSSELMGQPA